MATSLAADLGHIAKDRETQAQHVALQPQLLDGCLAGTGLAVDE
ncbi:hypothetical protein [Streptomyces sp. NRRL WC-3744]|nr:hypothetical protein [Streptomyces sp. NRRL WC-3744]